MSDKTISRHFVTFYSPGTMFAETTTREVPEWNPMLALRLSRDVLERYGARPYGFRFSTRSRGEHDLDSKTTAEGAMYYIDGKVETREEIEARNDPKESILRSNMRCNHIARVVVTCTPWKHFAALEPGDTVLSADGLPIHVEPATAKETDHA